ncbi:circadian clock KaiB family protein [Diaphorobacter caeni]|uniref:circadian clock KaiB family protein n=1 Tax=Diaphorobacter caeni TaxID=2784387 RepID=UPI00188DF584|nr:circadian clock KaiB family protein [Diaphorobacter caeni]MBF5005869.1 circadian clock KaiB family protein [Diaphorobacter caeni]
MAANTLTPRDEAAPTATTPEWRLRLYIAGKTTRAETALQNLEQLCEEHLAGRYSIEVIDLIQTPTLAAGDQILAVPTVVRQMPEPMRRIIGDLSNQERALVGLDIQPISSGNGAPISSS